MLKSSLNEKNQVSTGWWTICGSIFGFGLGGIVILAISILIIIIALSAVLIEVVVAIPIKVFYFLSNQFGSKKDNDNRGEKSQVGNDDIDHLEQKAKLKQNEFLRPITVSIPAPVSTPRSSHTLFSSSLPPNQKEETKEETIKLQTTF